MNKPVRLQLKRVKGFNLKELSKATNGLDVKIVSRPSRWGNPFEVKGQVTQEQAVQRFALHLYTYFSWEDREFQKRMFPWPVKSSAFDDWIKPLLGKNLACWCSLDQVCHADILLKLANEQEKTTK